MKERELREAEARAKQQTQLTECELAITIQANQGKAEYAALAAAGRAHPDAGDQPRPRRFASWAKARPSASRRIAGADAERAARVGIAQAIAIEEQVRAYGGPQFQLTQQVMNRFAEAIQVSQVDVVPKIVIGGQGGKDGGSPMTGNVMEALLTLMMSERLGGDAGVISTPRNASADAIRKRIEGDMTR